MVTNTSLEIEDDNSLFGFMEASSNFEEWPQTFDEFIDWEAYDSIVSWGPIQITEDIKSYMYKKTEKYHSIIIQGPEQKIAPSIEEQYWKEDTKLLQEE
ncbi:19424_t:CDS:2 [Dentiscutata erythropus]|uniref:19424_t:CDS:1 n=1 Tax=Dentiscutata erythropus TaxID=1348616 RepID=A0A9N9E288_9GLOM|nr:19424_t:CDS:2 [Dentiscutata erythropus]